MLPSFLYPFPLIWKLITGPLAFQATPSKVIYLSFVQTSLLSPFFQSPASQGSKEEAETTASDFSYFLLQFGGRRRIFQGLRVAKGTGHMSDVLWGYKILKVWRKQKLWKDSKGGEVRAERWENLPGNRGQGASEGEEINLCWNVMDEQDETMGKRMKERKKEQRTMSV